MSEKKIVMCGCHEYGAYLIPQLLQVGIQFSHFVVLTPEQGQRYEISGYHDFRPLADKHGIPFYVPETYALSSERDRSFFDRQSFDLLIQGGWQRLFPAYLLDRLSVGAIGVHGSADYLPKGRGRSPLNWSLIEGRKRFLLHLFLMSNGADDGDIIDVMDFDVNEFDDIRTLYYKNVIAQKKMLLRVIPNLLSGNFKLQKQSGEPSYYPKRSPEDGEILWEEMDVGEIYNLIRALTRPYPGAFGRIVGLGLVKVWKARILDTRLSYPDAQYGEPVESFDGKLVLNCRGGLLLLEDYSIECGAEA
ncbi:MAG: formyltransferase family protein [Parvibaculaceae bacterium]|mgnify:CR=1 FL=1|nr:formyltransferase family protein [Parvibaculaceae bacterium]